MKLVRFGPRMSKNGKLTSMVPGLMEFGKIGPYEYLGILHFQSLVFSVFTLMVLVIFNKTKWTILFYPISQSKPNNNLIYSLAHLSPYPSPKPNRLISSLVNPVNSTFHLHFPPKPASMSPPTPHLSTNSSPSPTIIPTTPLLN